MFNSLQPMDCSPPDSYVIHYHHVYISACSWPQLCPAFCDSMEPAGLLCPWNFSGKNIEVGYIYIYSLFISISPYSSFLHIYIYLFICISPSNICLLWVCSLLLCVGMYFYIYIVEITLNTNLYFLHLWMHHNMRYSDILKKRPFISVAIFAIEFYLGIIF